MTVDSESGYSTTDMQEPLEEMELALFNAAEELYGEEGMNWVMLETGNYDYKIDRLDDWTQPRTYGEDFKQLAHEIGTAYRALNSLTKEDVSPEVVDEGIKLVATDLYILGNKMANDAQKPENSTERPDGSLRPDVELMSQGMSLRGLAADHL